MNEYKIIINVKMWGNKCEIKKFVDEVETFFTFQPEFNVFEDFIGFKKNK